MTTPAMKAIAKPTISLIKAFEGIKTTHPDVWSMLTRGLVEMLGPETRHVIRCPPAVLPTAQGRAQVAEEILTLMDECSEKAAILRQTTQVPVDLSDPGGPPKFQ